jgi:hypothetical protein
MVSLVEAVREAVGDAVDISFDLHWRYNVSDAKRLAYELEPYGLMWLEDPVPPENIEAMRRVTQSTKTPISSGENYYMRFGFREALEKEALDIIAPTCRKSAAFWRDAGSATSPTPTTWRSRPTASPARSGPSPPPTSPPRSPTSSPSNGTA